MDREDREKDGGGGGEGKAAGKRPAPKADAAPEAGAESSGHGPRPAGRGEEDDAGKHAARGRGQSGEDAWSQSEEEDEEQGDDEADLPPPPDDGPLRVLPIRHLPLADDPGSPSWRSAEPFRATASREAGRRAWHWVPLGALVALLATTVLSLAAALLVPRAQESFDLVGRTIAGVESDEERLEAVEALLSGPHGDEIQSAVLAMIASSLLGLLLAGAIVSYYGRAGALEAGLATGTFALLSLLFLGGGFPVLGVLGVGIAFGAGWLGGRLGSRLRRRRDARRNPGDLG